MRKTTLSLFFLTLLGGTSAQAQVVSAVSDAITDASAFVDGGKYVITTISSGYLSSASHTCGATGTAAGNTNHRLKDGGTAPTVGSTVNENMVFTLHITTDGGNTYYAFEDYEGNYWDNVDHGAGTPADPVHMTTSPCTFTLALQTNNYWRITSTVTPQSRTVLDRGGADTGGIVMTSNPGANQYFAFYQLTFAEDPAATTEEIASAQARLAKAGKVGYPSTTSEAYTALKTAIETEGVKASVLNNALSAFYATTDVVLPEEGKAYTFKTVHMDEDGTRTYFNSTGTQVRPVVITSETELPLTAKFICKKVGDNFAFVNNLGQYLVYFGGGTYDRYESNNGVSSSYIADENQFKIAKFTAAESYVECSNEDLFGCLGVQGTRIKQNAPEFVYFVIKNTGELDAAAAPFVNKTTTNKNYLSSAILIEEVEYPNNVTFKAATNIAEINDNGLGLATFSAPYAAVVPSNVTAYTVQAQSAGKATLAPVSGAIPANTGVLLSGTLGETATMVPVTTETVTTVGTNLLEGSAGADKDLSAIITGTPLVLGVKDGTTAFYGVLPSDATIAMNKAYLVVPTGSGEGTIRLSFGDNLTGIDNVATAAEDAKVVDLSGRRVNKTTKGSLYISGGKVFIAQ